MEDGLVFGGVVGLVAEVGGGVVKVGVPYSSKECGGSGAGVAAGGAVGVDGECHKMMLVI